MSLIHNMVASFVVAAGLLLAGQDAAAQTAPANAKPAPSAAVAPDPAAESFKAWDKDRNGSLSPVEFRTGWQQVQRGAEIQARLRHQFGNVDANKNNAIDPAEYGSLLLVKQAGKNAPQMSVFDGNRDGKLGFGEYVRLVQTLSAQQAGKGAAE